MFTYHGTFRDIILSGTARTQPALQQEVTLLLDSVPASWAAHVCGPAPQPTHLVSATTGDSRVFCPDADGHLIHTYTVTPTAALQPALPLPEAGQQPPLPADLRPVSSWTGTRPGLGILATWDLRHEPATQTRFRHSLSLSHSWPSALTSLVPGQPASSTPDLGASAARVCRQDAGQPLAHAATHHCRPARRGQLHAASHLASRGR